MPERITYDLGLTRSSTAARASVAWRSARRPVSSGVTTVRWPTRDITATVYDRSRFGEPSAIQQLRLGLPVSTARRHWVRSQARGLRQRHAQVRMQPHDRRDGLRGRAAGNWLLPAQSEVCSYGGTALDAHLYETASRMRRRPSARRIPTMGLNHRLLVQVLRRQSRDSSMRHLTGSPDTPRSLQALGRSRRRWWRTLIGTPERLLGRVCAPASGPSGATMGPARFVEGIVRLPESLPIRDTSSCCLRCSMQPLLPIPVSLPPIQRSPSTRVNSWRM